MTIKLYMDHHVPRAIASGLRIRGVDVLPAYEDSSHRLSDPQLLDRATELGRLLFTRDDDFLQEAIKRQREGTLFLESFMHISSGFPLELQFETWN